MPGRKLVRPNLLSDDQKLVELQMVIAQATRDRRTPGEILLHERTHHFVLKPTLMIDDVVGDPDRLRDPARVINIIQRATASLHSFGHALVPG